jgi:hypothetical protein
MVNLWLTGDRQHEGRLSAPVSRQCGHPRGLRIDQETAGGEGDSVGDVAAVVMEPRYPALADDRRGQRLGAQEQQRQRQRAAEQGDNERIVGKMGPSEPQGGRGEQLGVATASSTKKKKKTST